MEFESNNPEGTALNINEAADLISQTLDVSEDSFDEQPDENVELPEVDEAVEAPETEETPEEQFFDIDGNQVSLSEIRSSYMRQADYTKKTQEIAEQRKFYQENQRDVNSLRSEALAGIEALKQQVSIEFRQMEYPDFDWLAENDPAEYVRQKAQWEKREYAVRQIYEAETALKQKAAAYEEEQRQIAIQESSNRFFEKYPDLKDKNKADEVFSDITGMLLDTGFNEQEIKSIVDFRIIDLLYRVVQAEKAQKAIPQVVEKIEKKPVISAKENSRKTAADYDRQTYEKFNQSRSVADAAALIKNLL
ncbi:hypothetical protein AGRO_3101 [Agrobacterium sp. ATCC 31749]|uniref:hypothetical protein n=1 Tax=unclassified Agrobacterium TaxID=2632611 RepID=UPI00020DB869|nr:MULTISPECIES: hypothetical protein [unclassified Agrobacterium]EGL64185.1 hypothetical protein AGRO_3101 [Agrobacterium sp. ATCC 31749]QKW96828.1 hypothetical protein GSF67_06810 [Agrobacterium sp. CGMCC 11546]